MVAFRREPKESHGAYALPEVLGWHLKVHEDHSSCQAGGANRLGHVRGRGPLRPWTVSEKAVRHPVYSARLNNLSSDPMANSHRWLATSEEVPAHLQHV